MLALLIALMTMQAAPAWQASNTGVNASLRGLAVGENVIWASGSGGTWLRSRDAGKTWTHGVVDKGLDFRGICALDDNTAVMFSSGPAEKGQARVFRTTDAGAHWTEVFRGTKTGMFLDAMKFWDTRHGIALSDPVGERFVILLTNDGGKTWREAPSDRMPPALEKEGSFAASNSALAVFGKTEAWFGTGGAGHGRVFHSNDRGHTWTVVETPIAADTPAAGIFSIAFRDAQQGVAVGGDYQKPTNSHDNVAITNDGGHTWKRADHSVALFLSGVSIGEGNIVAVGSGGWAFSSDRRTWTIAGREGFNAVVTTKSGVWAAGAKGAVAAYPAGAVK